MTSTRRSVTALTAAAALALGALPAVFTSTSILASGEEPATVESGTGAGSVVLSTTSSQGTVTWRDQTQTFTGGQQCEVTPGEDSDPVLDITGTIIDEAAGVARTAVAGFRDGLIGVFEVADGGPNNASQCFRSRSMMRKRLSRTKPSIGSVRFRAICIIQAVSGLGVAPAK